MTADIVCGFFDIIQKTRILFYNFLLNPVLRTIPKPNRAVEPNNATITLYSRFFSYLIAIETPFLKLLEQLK